MAAAQNKILLIGDLHNHVDGIEDLITSQDPALTIFLGDYFDNFGDGPFEMRKTALWLKESVQKPNRIHLLGNHDHPYLFPNNEKYRNWGWSAPKQRVFDEVFRDFNIKNKLKLFYVAAAGGQKILFTHAGWATHRFGSFTEWSAAETAKRAIENGHRNDPNPWLDSMVGPLWFRGVPFVEGYGQVFGHTNCKEPQVTILRANSWAANFDCAHTYVGYITDEGLYQLNLKTGAARQLVKFSNSSTN